MKNLVVSSVLTILCAAGLAASQSASHSLRYAYRCVQPEQGETLSVNWHGTIIWNKHANRDELWVQDGAKTFLILNKTVLDSMEAATVPLRKSGVTAAAGTQLWHEQREKERNAVYAKTDKIVGDALAKGLGKPATP